ncbi:GDSL-type esterase/lipase family protein [Fodinicola acaciae]|uniref:GDSL-type esterase/lipase family protein n=1 Tax=Fodinicola acaciae TaxID=2681555 RepID=UPI0013D7EA66|nr:GDSL-type esterase/lipase family protein [Fodinicola acaciae]
MFVGAARRISVGIGILALSAGFLTGSPPALAARPTAIVSMGDSYISGESAGSYDPGTNQPGNFCHRSAVSEIHRTHIAADRQVNLACSGATTANVRLGGTPQNGEAPQADRLRTVAAQNDVKLIVLSIGGNDAGFTSIVLDCIKAYFQISSRCQDTWASKLPAALAATAPKIRQNLADIRTVMRQAGYADSSYQLVLQSYPSVVTDDNRYVFTKIFEGCPLRNDDAKWAKLTAVAQFSSTMASVARQAGARFLDMSRAFYGREVCANGISHAQEWGSGIKIDLAQLRNGVGGQLVQQSLHPNASGHTQFANCLTSFYGMSAAAARCIRGSNGNLTAVASSVAALSTVVIARTYPVIAEPAPITDRKKAYAKEAAR